METRYLPKIGGFKEKNEHSLLFDSALTDRVLRQNAYEQRKLDRRTHVIERERQQSLEKLNFYQNKFLIRHLPVLCRRKNLEEALLLQSFAGKLLPSELKAEELAPSFSPKIRTRSGDQQDQEKKTEPSYCVVQENMEDVLNRTPRKQLAVSATSRTSYSACVAVHQTLEPDYRSSFPYCSERFNKTLESKKDGSESADIALPEIKFQARNILTRSCTSYSPLHSVKQIFNKEVLGNVRSFLDNIVTEHDQSAGGITLDTKNTVSFKQGNDMYFLSDAKIQQRQAAQRIRVMRTVVLAYDMILSERLKKPCKA